jgi:SAM-dependent methyltransferase
MIESIKKSKMIAGCIQNENKTGSSYPLSSISWKFVEFCKTNKKLILDIGIGNSKYGYASASIEALKVGAQVIAYDIEKKHLMILQTNAKKLGLLNNLQLIHGAFPYETANIGEGTLDAIHISFLFDLLSINDLTKSISTIYALLKPGGKVFSSEYTPYNKTIERFIPIYEQRCKNQHEWPGFVEDISLYCDDCENLPKSINHMDIHIMRRLFEKNKFHIEELHYLTNDKAIPKHMQLSGKECIGLIATKKQTTQLNDD